MPTGGIFFVVAALFVPKIIDAKRIPAIGTAAYRHGQGASPSPIRAGPLRAAWSTSITAPYPARAQAADSNGSARYASPNTHIVALYRAHWYRIRTEDPRKFVLPPRNLNVTLTPKPCVFTDFRVKAPRVTIDVPPPKQGPHVASSGEKLRGVPTCWFLDPLYNTLKTVVRPAVASMRRKEIVVRFSAPKPVFEKFLGGLGDDSAAGFTRQPNGRLKPTRSSASSFVYQYQFKKASVVQKLFNLERSDTTRGPTGKLPRGASKRGLGAARLHLSKAAQARGVKAKILSMACTAMLTIIEPKRQESMPFMTMVLSVLTMDQNGHITWPTNYDLVSRARLRKAARHQLTAMLADPLYPVDPSMSAALTQEADSYLDLAAVHAASAARSAALKVARATRLALLPPG